MKNLSLKTILLVVFMTLPYISIGQINPVFNLNWIHYYVSPNNYFELTWDEPALPHDELIGYNVYRENELYRFQTSRSLFNLEVGSNCGEDFLLFNNGNGFFAHVTAIYNPGEIESTFTETVYIDGFLIGINEFRPKRAIIYPNPSTGIINLGNENLKRILIYDIYGTKIKESNPMDRIDLTDISKGVYLVKLITNDGIFIEKIVLK